MNGFFNLELEGGGRVIKEAIHILWEKPTLNHQLFHVNLKLSL